MKNRINKAKMAMDFFKGPTKMRQAYAGVDVIPMTSKE